MLTPEMNQEEVTISLREIIGVIKKRLGLILVVFTVAVAAATVYSILTPPTYEAQTTIRVKKPQGAESVLSDFSFGDTMLIQELMATYAEILQSRTVVEEVIRKNGKAVGPKANYESVLGQITIKPVKETEILNITVAAGKATVAKDLANTLVNTFLERLAYLERFDQASVRDFVGERLRDSQQQLRHAEQDLETYKQQQKIVAPDDETKALVERFTQIDQLAAENKINIATAQTKLESVNRQLADEKGEQIADSPLITQYKAKLADLEIQLVGLMEKYTAKHPDVLAVRAEMEETKKKLAKEISQVVNAEAPSANPIHLNLLQTKIQAEAELKAALAQQGVLAKIQTAHEAEVVKLPAKEQELTRLMRDASVTQEIYVMLAKRFEEAKISEVMQPTGVQIIDRAVAPEKPVKPKKQMNVLIGAFLGLFAGIGLAFFLEHLYKTIDSADDVQSCLKLPVLGNIPDFNSKHKLDRRKGDRKMTAQTNLKEISRPLIVHDQVKSPIAESFRTLRTNIQYSKVDEDLKTILFTSTGPGEGKSTTAANTAVAFAQSGKKVLLIDSDLRKPVQHKIFGKENQGLTNFLVEENNLTELIQPTEVPNLDVLPSGPIPPNPSELLGSKRMLDLLKQVKADYDIVILDAPPLLAVTDASVLASRVDGVVTVVMRGKIRPEMARQAQELIIKAHGKVLGIVVTRVEITAEYSYYYYYYSA